VAMSDEDAPVGSKALRQYRKHGGGADLLRAYIQRRSADSRITTERRRLLTTTLERGLPFAEYNAVTAEMVMLDILADLDSVIRDVLAFSEDPGSQDDQLSRLRAALRIGKKTAPSAVASRLEAEKAVQGWIAIYLDMQKTGVYRSPRQLALEVACMLNIAARSATRYWDNFKKLMPHQAQWAAQIAARARRTVKVTRRRATATKSKSKARKPAPHQRLKFGR